MDSTAGWEVINAYPIDPLPVIGQDYGSECCHESKVRGACDDPRPAGLVLVGCVWKAVCVEHLAYHQQHAVWATARPALTRAEP